MTSISLTEFLDMSEASHEPVVSAVEVVAKDLGPEVKTLALSQQRCCSQSASS